MWIDWLPVAHAAAPACEALDESTFRAYVFDAFAGVERGDVELTTAIVEEVWGRLPCLTFSPDPGLWAELLVSRSILEFSRGGDWQDPLVAALRLRKGIDRGVGPGHPIASFEPPPDPPMGPPVPALAKLLVDGRPSPVLPPAEGLWLVQKTDGRFWDTLVLHDAPVPEGWASEPVVGPPRVEAWARVGASLGYGDVWSDPNWQPAGRVLDGDDARERGAPLGAQGDLHATFYSSFGVQGAARVSAMPRSPGLDGRALAIAERGAVTVGAGLAAYTVDVFRSDLDPGAVALETFTSSPLARAVVGMVSVRPRHRPLVDGGATADLSVVAGGSRGGGYADLDLGLATALGGRTPYRFGATAGYRSAAFAYTGVEDGRVTASSVRVLFRFDWVLGEY